MRLRRELSRTIPSAARTQGLDNVDLIGLCSETGTGMESRIIRSGGWIADPRVPIKEPKKELERSSLMNVGRRVDYAVRALTYLAGQPPHRVVTRADIEQKEDIPPYYLAKIMKDLVTGGLVRSHVGSKGGFTLAKPAKAISIKEVYETVEGPLVLMECLEKGDKFCLYCAVCTQRSIWEKARTLLANYLSGVFIGDIVDPDGLRERLVAAQG